MDYTLIKKINRIVQQKNKTAFFKLNALKKKYKLTDNDLKCVPKPHYKNIDFVLRICKAKNPQKKLTCFF